MKTVEANATKISWRTALFINSTVNIADKVIRRLNKFQEWYLEVNIFPARLRSSKHQFHLPKDEDAFPGLSIENPGKCY